MSKENNSNEIVSRLNEIRRLVTECEDLCLAVSKKSGPRKETSARKTYPVDFSIPIRPFVKKYGQEMSGPKKFALLVAYLTKGDSKKTISLEDLKKHWNKMTSKSLLGMKFNLFYCSSAKDNDWVYTPSTATYSIRPSWKEIL